MEWVVLVQTLVAAIVGGLLVAFAGLLPRWYERRIELHDRKFAAEQQELRLLRMYVEEILAYTMESLLEIARGRPANPAMLARAISMQDKALLRMRDPELRELVARSTGIVRKSTRLQTSVAVGAVSADLARESFPRLVIEAHRIHRGIRKRMDDLGWPDGPFLPIEQGAR